jgi:hypothetical protein
LSEEIMNMGTTSRIFGLLLGLATLPAPVAKAATVTRVFVTGTSANLNLVLAQPGSRPDCTVDISVLLTASTTVQRAAGGPASTGAVGFVQRIDNCAGTWEFGSFNVALPSSALTTGNSSAALTATIPLAMELIPEGGTVNRTLAVALQFTNVENNSVESRSFGTIRAPQFTMVTRGKSVSNAADISGQLTLDGVSLLTPPTSLISTIDSGSSFTIDITR